jgi:hypothetical protein
MLTVLNNLIVQISQKIDNLNAFEYSVVDFSLITTWFNEISLYSCKRTPTLQKSNITILKIYFMVITYISSKAKGYILKDLRTTDISMEIRSSSPECLLPTKDHASNPVAEYC